MKLTTQDGRVLEISREYRLFVSGYSKGKDHSATVTVTTFTKVKRDEIPYSERHKYLGYNDLPYSELVEHYGTVGEYATNTARGKAADALQAAWDSGASEFTMPQDTGEISEAEKFNDFCKEHRLTLVTINELGYKPSDIPRNMRIWRETSDFERRNILVADSDADINAFGGAYSTSLAKWQALQGQTA